MWGLTLGYRTAIETAVFSTRAPGQYSLASLQLLVAKSKNLHKPGDAGGMPRGLARLRFELLKILLVDDNQHMRVLLTEILRAIGVKLIFEAADGAQALHMLRGNPIDIVMTDLAMEPMDGIDFVRLLRNSEDSPNPMVPVIMITGHSTMRRVGEARDVGVTEFL